MTEDRRQRKEDKYLSFAFGWLSSVLRPPSSVLRHRGFTLVESMASVALLAFIGASVWLVLEQCTVSAADSIQRMRAFEIAHENMEKLLGLDSVQEKTEYGISEKFQDIRWQTSVESFYEPATSSMWARAVCSAEYTDSGGETKNVELTCWLTGLTAAQSQQLAARLAMQNKLLARHIIATEELAAEYAGVDAKTIQQWVKNGMPMTESGEYLKPWLDLYLQTNGNPTEQDRQDTLAEYSELSITKPKKATKDGLITPGSQPPATPEPQVQPDSDSSNPETTTPQELDPKLQKEIDELMKKQ
jgi:prepilin-type N-terminal cleavage/methylation domain-containing protein